MNADSAFWDTSALLPLFCNQPFSLQVRKVRRMFPVPVIWWGTTVEVHSGLDRLRREGLLTERAVTRALDQWRLLYRGCRRIRPDESVLHLAATIPARYGLRALDSFQLGAALHWCNERPRNRPFITGDVHLGNAAENAGFRLVLMTA